MEKCFLTSLNYELQIQKRKTIAIKILTDGRLLVKANSKTEKSVISNFLLKRQSWILKVRSRVLNSTKLTGPFSYSADEEHLYLGKSYSLSLLLREKLDLHLIRYPERKIKKCLEEWYTEKAVFIFQDRINRFLFKFAENKRNKKVELKTKFMKSLWGSCSTNGRITLNTHLVKLPLYLIDYVILHEICHLAVMNHGKMFYRLMDKYMSDWKFRKEKIKTFLTS